MPTAYSHKECPFVYCDSQDGDCIKQGRCHYAPIEEPAATIQAIREATERHTTSPEAAREFLQESGIAENNGWIEVKGRDWFSKTIKERDVVVLFDTGEVRRYAEENWPFSEVTHYCLLPAKPAPPKTKQ